MGFITPYIIRPVISWGEKRHWGEVPLDSHDSFVYIGVVFWPVTLEKENVLMRASPHLCLIDSINLDANKVPILGVAFLGRMVLVFGLIIL